MERGKVLKRDFFFKGPKERAKLCATPGAHSNQEANQTPLETRAELPFLAESCYFCSACSDKISHSHQGCRVLGGKVDTVCLIDWELVGVEEAGSETLGLGLSEHKIIGRILYTQTPLPSCSLVLSVFTFLCCSHTLNGVS